jgi:hypothetical protein
MSADASLGIAPVVRPALSLRRTYALRFLDTTAQWERKNVETSRI